MSVVEARRLHSLWVVSVTGIFQQRWNDSDTISVHGLLVEETSSRIQGRIDFGLRSFRHLCFHALDDWPSGLQPECSTIIKSVSAKTVSEIEMLNHFVPTQPEGGTCR